MLTFQVCTLANVLLAVITISTCAGFLLYDGDNSEGTCFPQDQFCSCFENGVHGDDAVLEIACSSQNLTKVPNFRKNSEKVIGYYIYWRINLTDNELTTIPTAVFSIFNGVNNFSTDSSVYMSLRFERNKISTIENGAFVGINNLCLTINLTDNRITALPLAFQLLSRLSALSLQGNPILTFDATVVNSIAYSLDFLELDYKALLSGNKELSVLNLTTMTVYDIPSDSGNVTFNPFRVFENTMEDMFIVGTEFITLPCFLINGSYMYKFSLQDATNISAISVFDCQTGTRLQVSRIKIMFSGLDEFPDILKFSKFIDDLNLSHNKISSTNENFIPLNNNLRILDLSYNRLQTIPSVFSRFKYLHLLFIDYNQITTVAPESNVLRIESLCATSNPWTHDESHCKYDYEFFDRFSYCYE